MKSKYDIDYKLILNYFFGHMQLKNDNYCIINMQQFIKIFLINDDIDIQLKCLLINNHYNLKKNNNLNIITIKFFHVIIYVFSLIINNNKNDNFIAYDDFIKSNTHTQYFINLYCDNDNKQNKILNINKLILNFQKLKYKCINHYLLDDKSEQIISCKKQNSIFNYVLNSIQNNSINKLQFNKSYVHVFFNNLNTNDIIKNELLNLNNQNALNDNNNSYEKFKKNIEPLKAYYFLHNIGFKKKQLFDNINENLLIEDWQQNKNYSDISTFVVNNKKYIDRIKNSISKIHMHKNLFDIPKFLFDDQLNNIKNNDQLYHFNFFISNNEKLFDDMIGGNNADQQYDFFNLFSTLLYYLNKFNIELPKKYIDNIINKIKKYNKDKIKFKVKMDNLHKFYNLLSLNDSFKNKNIINLSYDDILKILNNYKNDYNYHVIHKNKLLEKLNNISKIVNVNVDNYDQNYTNIKIK
jgi:hypothetical protein